MDQPVEFGMFVRSVPGYAVPRYGTAELIGASREVVTRESKRDGKPAISWNDRIVPLPKQYCFRYTKELNQHISSGELELCALEDWVSQCKADDEAQKAEESAINAATNTDDESGKADDK
jgi:hypothetical protein